MITDAAFDEALREAEGSAEDVAIAERVASGALVLYDANGIEVAVIALPPMRLEAVVELLALAELPKRKPETETAPPVAEER